MPLKHTTCLFPFSGWCDFYIIGINGVLVSLFIFLLWVYSDRHVEGMMQNVTFAKRVRPVVF